MAYKDYMVRATAANAQIRAFAATTKDLAEYGRKAHNLSPIAAAALGRLMTGAVMMGTMMDEEDDLITVKIDGDGPMKGALATADKNGNVKGYVINPYVIMEPNAAGHLNVGGGFGEGTLTVIRDMGLKEPYVGQVPLYTGEVAEDLTYYFSKSEQTPSSVGLGVLVEREELSVIAAGGFIIQLLPFADDETILQMMNLGAETAYSSNADAVKKIVEQATISDALCMNATSTQNITIAYENLNKNIALSTDTTVDDYYSILEKQLAAVPTIKYTKVSGPETVQMAGKDFLKAVYKAEMNNLELEQAYYLRRVDDFILLISCTAYNMDEDISTFENYFSAL